MTILAISDLHGRHRLLDLSKYKADILIYAGDWTKGKDVGLSESADFLHWMDGLTQFKHKICIAGNHERTVEQNSDAFEELTLMYDSITYLHNAAVTIDGYKIWGSPYSVEFCGWAFMKADHNLKSIWRTIPDDTNIIVTHTPAYGHHDAVKRAYGRDPHVGSKSLTKRKQELVGTLKAHICGHIHEAYGVSDVDGCANINASILNEKYEMVNKPILLEIKD